MTPEARNIACFFFMPGECINEREDVFVKFAIWKESAANT
jgi:hypothetical protein